MRDTARSILAADGLILTREHPRLRTTLLRMTRTGELTRLLPGVFAESGRVHVELWLQAVCRWCPQGVLHHSTALAFWFEESPRIPIRLAGPVPREPRKGIQFTRRPVPPEYQLRGRVNVVTAGYAAVELAATDDGQALTRVLRQGLVAAEALPDLIDSLRGTPGQATRRRIVTSCYRNPWSFAELRLHQILMQAGITGWVANPRLVVAGHVVYPDVYFAAQRLIVEFDGFETHRDLMSFRRDRERQNALVLADYRVLRVIWEHVMERPDYVVATVRQALAGDR